MYSKLVVALIAAFSVLAPCAIAEDAKPVEKKAESTEKKSEKKEKKEKKGKKASDGETLKALAESLTKSLQANEVETVLGYFAEDFASPMISNKASLKSLLELGSNSGTFSGLTADSSKTKYVVEGDKATVGPWDFSTGGESGTANFTCVKKDGDWKITGLDISGVSF